MLPSQSITIRGLGALSALGENITAHRDAILRHELPFRPIGELLDCAYPTVPAAWIAHRNLLTHRKWSPAAMAGLHVAKQAIAQANWTAADLNDAVLILGTSRGGAAGWIEPWPGRRGFPLMAASNAMHGEAAAAISIECGIRGAYHVVSTGCSAGIDALGLAAMHLQAGVATRALVVAVDLPLVKFLLDSYHATGILSRTGINDPYHPQTSGIFPAEAAAAVTLEMGAQAGEVALLGYLANSDACDPLSLSPASGQLTALIQKGIAAFGSPAAVCPHATGTASHALAEPACLAAAFPAEKPSLHLLKPHLGHGIGAGSLLEIAILCEFLRHQQFPPNRHHLTAPHGFLLPSDCQQSSGSIMKIAASLGGHNALVSLRRT